MAAEILDKLKLIRSVQRRRILWDQKNELHFDRDQTKIAWKEVSREIGFSTEECRKKWRNLRDIFTREIKKKELERKCTWRYFKPLMFLIDQIKINNQICAEGTNGMKSDIIEEIHQDAYFDQGTTSVDIEDSKAHFRELPLIDEIKSNGSFQTTKILNQPQLEIDDDYHFVMSILPSMRSLPKKRKNVVRTKILQVLCEENV